MSTNFYTLSPIRLDKERIDDMDPSVHIGKLWSKGGGKLGFIWAMKPDALEGHRWVWDEYGDIYSRKDFTSIIARAEPTFDIGAWFA